VYLYFRDKRDLFEHVLARELLRWNEALRKIEAREGESRQTDPLRQLESILIECFDYVDRDPVLLRHLHEAWALAPGTIQTSPGAGAAELESRTADLVRTFTRSLDRALVAGSLPPEADPNLEARWIWSQVVGALVTKPFHIQIARSQSQTNPWKDAPRRILSALRQGGSNGAA